MTADFQTLSTHVSRWPHRLAILLCCATFPLVWIGGLVTTYKAGMAFPDWPTSDGYFLFFYPWLDWLRSPWELFVEHGHRMLAASVGLITIALCVALWVTSQPRSLRILGILAVVAVIFQGLLGGARVLLDERTLAMFHGCFGPVFFSLTAILTAVTSKSWKAEPFADNSISVWAFVAAVPPAVFFQLVLGAHLRHYSPDGSRFAYSVIVFFHVVFAFVVAALIFGLAIAALRRPLLPRAFRVIEFALPALIVVQIALGAATWIYKYNWPAFMANLDVASNFTIQAMGWRQAQITTAHVALGSLILALSSVSATYAIRILWANRTVRQAALTHSVFLSTGKFLAEATA